MANREIGIEEGPKGLSYEDLRPTGADRRFFEPWTYAFM